MSLHLKTILATVAATLLVAYAFGAFHAVCR